MRRSRFPTGLPGLVVGLLVLPAAVNAGGVGADLSGAWDVEHVAVDAEDQMHWKFHPDDPQLLGRELVIDDEQVRFNGGREANCKPPGWSPHASTWGFLMTNGFLRGGTPYPRGGISPAAFGLRASPKQSVTVYSVCSPAANRADAPSVWVKEPWLVPQGPDRLLMRYDEAILTLARRKAGAKPRASFPCSKATSPTEKTICSSFSLAAWDRSVALGWRRLTANGTASEDLEEQKAWLRTRDACGADAACLEEQLKRRALNLADR
jgi:hypothetical protein